jgi:hypothetical protein
MDSSTGVPSSLELEVFKTLSQLNPSDKRKVLEYIESLVLLEGAQNEQRDTKSN